MRLPCNGAKSDFIGLKKIILQENSVPQIDYPQLSPMHEIQGNCLLAQT